MSRKYKWMPGYTGVIRIEDGHFIPMGAADWAEVSEWMAAGGEPEPIAPRGDGARLASAKTLRYVLIDLGKLDAWEQAVASSNPYVRAYWASEPNPPENNPKMIALAAAAGVDIERLYDLAARR